MDDRSSSAPGGRELTTGPRPARLLAVLVGLLALGSFLSLFNSTGFRSELARGFVYVGAQEGLFWLAHIFLLTPGVLLLAGVMVPRFSERFGEIATWCSGGSLRRRLALAIGYGICLGLLAFGYRHVVLLDMPVTGDENVVAFGARMIAEGHLSVPVPEARAALPLHFTYTREGRISSFDYPGGLFFTALSMVTGTGPVLFALLVALSSAALPIAGAALAGRQGALAAAGLWLVSPMVFTLSATLHPQLLSRSFCALAIAAYCVLLRRPRGGRPVGALLGVAAGLAFLCRPIESASLLTPIAVHLSLLAWREPRRRPAWFAVVLAFLPSVAAFAAYNQAITGSLWMQARFTPQLAGALATEQGARHLLGTNLGFNVMMLGIFGLGPLGLLLVGAGLSARGVAGMAGRTLAAGVVLQLAVALLHHDTGIHLVGPIHYAETATPLVLLAVLGLRQLARGRTALRLRPDALRSAVCGVGASLLIFIVVHSLTLRDQALTQRLTFDAVAAATLHNAVVVAEPPYRLWDLRPEITATRSWVVTFPPPDPWLRDDVILALDRLPLSELRAYFPDRDVVRMSYHAEGEPIRFQRLERREGRR